MQIESMFRHFLNEIRWQHHEQMVNGFPLNLKDPWDLMKIRSPFVRYAANATRIHLEHWNILGMFRVALGHYGFRNQWMQYLQPRINNVMNHWILVYFPGHGLKISDCDSDKFGCEVYVMNEMSCITCIYEIPGLANHNTIRYGYIIYGW